MATKLTPVEELEGYQVIIRAIWTRGIDQQSALAELCRRGLWLSADQRKQAGID
jgi:hypothetical protein